MKKHPVDDLFRRRVENVEMKPSSNAWKRIEERSQAQKRKAFGVWYAAASILIAAAIGYNVLNNQKENLVNPESNRAVTANMNENKPKAQKHSETSVGDNVMNQEPATQVVAEAKSKTIQKSPADNRTGKRIADKKGIQQTHVPQPERERLASVEYIIKNETEEKQEPAIDHQVVEIPAVAPHQEPTRTIVVAIETAEDDLEKPKVSKFSKIFRQLKNARAGERVDWQEVGFNPKNLVAKVDDRLRNKDDRASDKNQNSKERNNL